MKTKENKDFIDELETMLSEERVERAKKEAEKEIFQIRLSESREKEEKGVQSTTLASSC
ncbi:MAG: hypothetical protein QME81_17365 [bacterium]|nr:hypothetical protein [bacterium]